MANSNFVVQNGLTVGPLTIDAATGSITTSGTVNITGGLAVSSINKNDSAITINDTGTSGSNISIAIDGVIEHTVSATGVNLASGTTYAINGANVLTSTGLGSGVTTSSLTSVGTLTSLAVGAVTSSGTIIASTVNAGTIGNSGATLTGTLSTATQNSVTTMTGLTGFGTAGVTTTAAGNFTVTGNMTVNGTTTTINNTTVETTEYVQTIDASIVRSATLGNIGANHVGTGTYLTSLNASNLSSGTVPSSILGGSSLYIGTTSIALNRASATQSLTGITSIDGSAATLTTSRNINGVAFNGSADITVTAAAGTLTGATLASGVTASSLTSVGTLTGLTVSGAVAPNTNNTINLGGASNYWATVYGTSFVGTSTTAKYADLAENYQADSNYAYGTVVMFGGSAEVTVADAETTAVAGVVSQNPAHLMNGGLTGNNVVPLALQGRVPCNVIGPVKKGDMMVSAGFGYAKASANPQVGQVIGKALNDFTGAKGQIEVVVGRV